MISFIGRWRGTFQPVLESQALRGFSLWRLLSVAEVDGEVEGWRWEAYAVGEQRRLKRKGDKGENNR